LLRRRGISNIRFHDLRHSHASQLLRAGISPKVISERLGHSKVGFTLDVYSHLLPGIQEEAAQKTDAGLRAAI
jgi:integrase